MSSVVEKSLAIIEALVEQPAGLSVSNIAAVTGQPVSGVHRTLHELIRLGYVRQVADGGDYALSIKLAALGLGFMRRARITDIVQPILDRLAQASGELIRLSVIDGARLTWVAVAQGATTGLRYDPGQEQGVVVHLATSAGGRAWLATMTDEEALEHVSAQGFARDDGPGKPIGIPELLAVLDETRQRGYSIAVSSYIPGMAAMAVPVHFRGNREILGCLSIAGPSVRMTDDRMAGLAPLLQASAEELGMAAPGSQYFSTIIREMEANKAS